MPETKDVPCIKVKVAVVIVKEFISSLKVAVSCWLNGTSAAAFPGFVVLTVGVVVIGGEVNPSLWSHPAIIKTVSNGINHNIK